MTETINVEKPEPRIQGEFKGEIKGKLTTLSVSGSDAGGDICVVIDADDGTKVAMNIRCGEDNDLVTLTITRDGEVVYKLDEKDGDRMSTPALYYDEGALSVSETGFTFWDWNNEDEEHYLSVDYNFKNGTATFKLE